MPFTPVSQNPGDLITSSDWNDAMTAIAQLFDKLHQATGHQHTGAVEDAPPIDTAGLADNAVTTVKIADATVTNAKLANDAVTTAKIVDAAVTAAKIASGVVPSDIGITVTTGLTDGQTIPIPAGFLTSECIFFACIKWLWLLSTEDPLFNCYAQTDGEVFARPEFDAATGRGVVATGIAFAKKGGW